MKRQVFPFEHDGQRVLGFDTGLDSRAFAQAKFAQCITEPGLIVRPDGGVELWKASGVVEYTINGEDNPSMVVWGPLFEGEFLETLFDVNENANPDEAPKAAPLTATEAALEAVTRWIRAVLALEKTPHVAVLGRLSAAIIGNGGDVFFAPESLALRCMAGDGRYTHPDLQGMEAAAFSAAAMLYRIFAGTPPFPAADEMTLRQDMRDGHFVPPRLAVPGLATRLAALIYDTLSPAGKQSGAEKRPGGAAVLEELLALVRPGGKIVPAESFVLPLAETERLSLEKEKNQFLKIKTASVNTRRFVTRNSIVLLGSLAVLVIAGLITFSIVNSHANRPTTVGMEPVQVIESYYNAFNDLDHTLMEGCVTNDAGKDDIGMVINLYVMTKMRQAYEMNAPPLIVSAREWQTGGSPPDIQAFGVTDLRTEPVTNSGSADTLSYRVNYTFWVPAQLADQSDSAVAAAGLSVSYQRSDIVTLIWKKERWQIAEISRGSLTVP